MAGSSGPTRACAGAKRWAARPKARAKTPTSTVVDAHPRTNTSVRDVTSVARTDRRPRWYREPPEPGWISAGERRTQNGAPVAGRERDEGERHEQRTDEPGAQPDRVGGVKQHGDDHDADLGDKAAHHRDFGYRGCLVLDRQTEKGLVEVGGAPRSRRRSPRQDMPGDTSARATTTTVRTGATTSKLETLGDREEVGHLQTRDPQRETLPRTEARHQRSRRSRSRWQSSSASSAPRGARTQRPQASRARTRLTTKATGMATKVCTMVHEAPRIARSCRSRRPRGEPRRGLRGSFAGPCIPRDDGLACRPTLAQCQVRS